jgi:hypothetical protein
VYAISNFSNTCYISCQCHLLLYSITKLIFGEEYKLWSSTLCSFLCPVVTSSLIGPNILITLFSNPSIHILPSQWESTFNFSYCQCYWSVCSSFNDAVSMHT